MEKNDMSISRDDLNGISGGEEIKKLPELPAAVKNRLSEKLGAIEARYDKSTAVFARKNICENALIEAEE